MQPEQSELIIRDRRDGDLEAIVALALESMTWHADTFDDIRPAPTADALRSGFRELVPTADSYFRVAEVDDRRRIPHRRSPAADHEWHRGPR